MGHPAKLAKALREGDIKTVRKMVRGGAMPHWSWVCETMRGGHLELAEMLLKSGAERNVFTLSATGDVGGLTRRLGRNPSEAQRTASMEPNSLEVTPLHVGCASDWRSHGQGPMTAQAKMAKVLVDHGANLNAAARYRGLDSATPLFCACWSSANLALVRWLLDRGARATDRDFWAALGHFHRHGQEAFDIAEALLGAGVPVDGSAAGYRTPLQGFAHMAAHRTVAWLITHGAAVNARGPAGRTAAHYAAERNTGPATLAILADSGADLTARDDDGRTPLDLARLNGKTRIVKWLKRRLRANIEIGNLKSQTIRK